ncbi:hypothetical protein [Candidatus Hodarchaeum mangrovi]
MKKTTVIVLLIFGLNVLGSNFLINSILIESGDERIFVEPLKREKIQILTSTESISEPYISIDGNEDFCVQATLNSWPGDGSAGNPFIIADQEIEISDGIFISNTDVNFEIRNITIESTVNLVNVKNSRIYDNVIGKERVIEGFAWIGAIRLENSSNNFIINNTVRGFVINWRGNFIRYNSGIVLDNCTNTLISENNASVMLHESKNNTILNNSVYELELENSGDNTIINNKILINTPDTPGIDGWIYNPKSPRFLKIGGNALNQYQQFLVENNTIGEKEIFYYRDLNNKPILENLTTELAEVILVNCSFMSIRNKEFDVNSSETIPISLNYCNDMIIDNCSRREYFDEIWESIDIFIHQSQNITISNNDEMIIQLQSVSNSTILNNNEMIIGLQSVSNNTILNNNGVSIFLELNISYNSIVNNSVRSLNCASSYSISNNVIKNNIVDNNPIFEIGGENNIFRRNIVDLPIRVSGYHNQVYANNLTNLYLDEFSAYMNYIYTNNFMSDIQGGLPPTYDDGKGNIFVYNFWKGWTGPDKNNDGYVDNPYLIGGTANNQDSSPSSVPFDHNHIVHLVTTPIVIFPNGREVLSSSGGEYSIMDTIHVGYYNLSHITFFWVPAIDSHNHGVNYSVFLSSDAGITWKLIAQNLVETELQWDASTLTSDYDYLIKVVTTCTEGLTVSDTSDEPFTIFNPSSTTKPNVTPSSSMFNVLVLLIIVVFIRRLRSRRLFLK